MFVKFAFVYCVAAVAVSPGAFGQGPAGARALSEFLVSIAEAMHLGPGGSSDPGRLIDAFAGMPVVPEDHRLLRTVTETMPFDFGFNRRLNSPTVDGMSRIVYRYGRATRKYALFPLPVGESNVALRRLENPLMAEIALGLPDKRKAFVDILHKELPRLGFRTSWGETFGKLSFETLALWTMMVRLLAEGDDKMRLFAETAFALMRNDDPAFSTPSRYRGYLHLLFDDWRDEGFTNATISALRDALAHRQGSVAERSVSFGTASPYPGATFDHEFLSPNILSDRLRPIFESFDASVSPTFRAGSMGKGLRESVERLVVVPDDFDLQRNILEELSPDRFEMSPRHPPMGYILDGLSRLAFRYGSAADGLVLFPFPVGEEVVLRSIKNPEMAFIASRVPREREELAGILRERLPRLFDFRVPSDELFENLPIEKMALWVLVIRLADEGRGRVRSFAQAVLELAKADNDSGIFFSSRAGHDHFFRLFFDNWFDEEAMDGWTAVLRDAHTYRQSRAAAPRAAVAASDGVFEEPMEAFGTYNLSESLAPLARVLDLQLPVKVDQFKEALAGLSVASEDLGLQRRIVEGIGDGNLIDGESMTVEASLVDNISRLVFRYGTNVGRYDVFPLLTGGGKEVVLRSIGDTRIAAIASGIPRGGREETLGAFLGELSNFGLKVPLEKRLGDISVEEMALWILIFRLAREGEGHIQGFAGMWVEVMQLYDAQLGSFLLLSDLPLDNIFLPFFADWRHISEEDIGSRLSSVRELMSSLNLSSGE